MTKQMETLKKKLEKWQKMFAAEKDKEMREDIQKVISAIEEEIADEVVKANQNKLDSCGQNVLNSLRKAGIFGKFSFLVVSAEKDEDCSVTAGQARGRKKTAVEAPAAADAN